MRILEINKFSYPRRGAERHFLDLIASLRSRGEEVAVLSMDDPRNVLSGPYDRVVSYAGYNRDDSNPWQRIVGTGRLFWSFEARRRARAMLDEFRPDVVHIHNAYHQLSLSFYPLIRNRGIPIVQTVHDYHLISPDKDEYHPSVGASYWKFLLIPKYGFGKRLLLVLKAYWERLWDFRGMVDRFVTPSRYVKRVLVEGGIPEERIVVLPHFVEAADVPVADRPGEPYALYFGAVAAEKNVTELAGLFERLNYPIRLAGKKTVDIREGASVKYVGEQSKDGLAGLIAGASFVVSASRLPETFGLIVLEANILGKPFFGYRTGAFPELVEDGQNGWLAETPEAFASLVSRATRGEAAVAPANEIRRSALARYGADAYAARLGEIFRHPLDSRADSR